MAGIPMGGSVTYRSDPLIIPRDCFEPSRASIAQTPLAGSQPQGEQHPHPQHLWSGGEIGDRAKLLRAMW